METIIHKHQPYEDVVREITIEDRQNPDFLEVEDSIEKLYREVGATVVGGLSYSGEAPTATFFIHARQSAAMLAFENRPA